MLTTVALTTKGWTASEPITNGTGFDLRTRDGQHDALQRQDEYDPDVTTLAFPCTPWTITQNMSMKIPGNQERLMQQKLYDHPFLDFTRKVCEKQKRRGKLFVVEQPDNAASWQKRPMRQLEPISDDVMVDMCTQGLRDPMTKGLMTNRTRLRTNAPTVIRKFATNPLQNQTS